MPSSLPTDTEPSIDDIRAAAGRISSIAVRTPLLESPLLNAQLGGRLLLKCEMFQPMGAFKIRGAWNCISQLTDAERTRGVIAFSSGNHAQAVALTAREFGIAATIVMPSNAPQIKIDNTRGYGATVILYDRQKDDREAIAAKLVEDTGAVIVPPYDHADIIAGQGTVGLEITEQCAALNIVPDAVIVPCSGGGLIAGTAIALRDAWPETDVFAAEPAGFDDTIRSLKSGVRETAEPQASSICDALLVETPGALTFGINRRLLAGGFAVTDDEVRAAMAAAFTLARLVVEPGGAAGLAACVGGRFDGAGKTTCVVLSGGNTDPALFADVIRPR